MKYDSYDVHKLYAHTISNILPFICKNVIVFYILLIEMRIITTILCVI